MLFRSRARVLDPLASEVSEIDTFHRFRRADTVSDAPLRDEHARFDRSLCIFNVGGLWAFASVL